MKFEIERNPFDKILHFHIEELKAKKMLLSRKENRSGVSTEK